MKFPFINAQRYASAIGLFIALSMVNPVQGGDNKIFQIGLAQKDISPELPIRTAGYAARNKPSDKIDCPLKMQAVAFKPEQGSPFIIVTLDNCELSREYVSPVITELESQFKLSPGSIMILPSHTHSAPIMESTLEGMYKLSDDELAKIKAYGQFVLTSIGDVVKKALEDVKPYSLEYGVGTASFAMNRRSFREDGASTFAENRDGPVLHHVPVLKISQTNQVKAILFGYSCHGTSIHGDDFYTVSPDYMGYARMHLESVYPGAMAVYITGMGADINPVPRGALLWAKRHGLELAGAVATVLNQPMKPIRGNVAWGYQELALPLMDPPQKAQIEADAAGKDVYIQARAQKYQKMVAEGKPLPTTVRVPIAAVKLGEDLTFLAMAGEVVVDYAIKFNRIFQEKNPWVIGYAYEVPCYIPSIRILKEGGYESESSLIYYGIYGPFQPKIESQIVQSMTKLVDSLNSQPSK